MTEGFWKITLRIRRKHVQLACRFITLPLLLLAATTSFSQQPEKTAAEYVQAGRVDDEPETKSAALLVLMAMLENATHPKALANSAKHFAFRCCGELNSYCMVDAQVAVLEGQLLA